MAAQEFNDWDVTPGNNTTIGSGAIDIDEGCAPGNVNDALREIMAACVSSAGIPGISGTARPSGIAAGSFWLDTTTATAPIITFYDGTDDIQFATVNYTTNVISLAAAVTGGSGIANVVEDTTPQLGGNLDVNGKSIVSASNGDVTIAPNGTGDIVLGFQGATVTDVTGADTTLVSGTAGTSTYTAQWNADGDLVDGYAFLDEDDMASDSATSIASQQSIKAYVDATAGSFTRGTAVTTTSGTTADFTGVAAGTDHIVVMFSGVSLSGTDNLKIQIGDSGGLETSGYVSASGNGGGDDSSTSGFLCTRNSSGTDAWRGTVTLSRVNGNVWSASGTLVASAGDVMYCAGDKTLSGELTLVTVLPTGSNTFDAGTVNIMSM